VTAPIYFLSYSREDIDDVKIIAQTLMIHGIEIWQDIANLGAGIAERKIRQAIREDSDGLVLLLTSTSAKSDFIRAVELPEAENRYKKDSAFHILPVFGLPIDKATMMLENCLTIPITNFNGVKVNGKENSQDILAAAERAAEIIFEDINLDLSEPVCIGLSSKQRVSKHVALHLDFTSFFEAGLPPTSVWMERFYTAMQRIKKALVKENVLSLRLYAFSHLSLGYLFGYVFRTTTTFRLEIEQTSKDGRTIWATEAPCEDNPLKVVELPGTLRSKDLCVKINLMSPDDGSVLRCAKERGILYRAVLELSPESYPCMISGGQANTIAKELAHKIKEMHAKYDTNRVHLFTAIPLGLAVLIGHNMNACGTVQCYEFDNGTREYSPSCTLA